MVQQRHPASSSGVDRPQDTSDFGVLSLDLTLKVEPRSAPDPLRAAPPERLERVRKSVRNIAAARRAGTDRPAT